MVRGDERMVERTGSEREWLRVRGYLTKNRYELSVSAAGAYPMDVRVAGTPLLADRRWLPPVPLDIDDVDLLLETGNVNHASNDGDAAAESLTGGVNHIPGGGDAAAAAGLPTGGVNQHPGHRHPGHRHPGHQHPGHRFASGLGPRIASGLGPRRLNGGETVAELVRPLRADGSRYAVYSAALARLAAPAVFVNRPTYRLLEADLTGGRGRLVFSRGRYFDGQDVGEACAHEYAAHALGGTVGGTGGEGTGGCGGTPLRAAVGNPCDLSRRPANVAISALTLRLDRSAGTATFLLHWRDPAKVGHAGGLYQVVPTGVFQPSGDAAWNERNDFNLWRSIVREYAEELLGGPEDYDSERAPIDYDRWPFAAHLGRARRDGQVRAFVLGMGTDPLTFATDILTAVVFDAAVFDELFAGLVTHNDEGRIVSARAGATADVPDAASASATSADAGGGIPFTADTVGCFARGERMQAAGAALLALAWQHRMILLA